MLTDGSFPTALDFFNTNGVLCMCLPACMTNISAL
jgi:hypothetical protein